MKRTLVTTLLAGTALMLGSAAGSTAAPSHSSGVGGISAMTCDQKGTGTGDWEVTFGTRVIRRKAVALLASERRKGFRRALIEREQCLYEVSIIHLSHPRANTLAQRARRKGLRVLVVQS